MAITLEQYMAEATNAYKPAQTAIQTQLDALAGQLETAEGQINKNYANQQAELENQRNQAASAASMQAAGSGGSFGGMANIANRKYYEQSFVPAQTRLQTNQANELSQARQASENQRTNLNSQLASTQAQINNLALQKYWAALEEEAQRQFQIEQAEKQRQWEAQQAELNRQAQAQAQREATAAQNSYYQYLMEAMKNEQQQQQPTYKNWDFGNGYTVQEGTNGQAIYLKDGKAISAGTWLGNTMGGAGTGGSVRWDLWNDIWNNGVRTNGVGSDTIDAINKSKGVNLLTNYRYLFN